jgi:hypothetical protein
LGRQFESLTIQELDALGERLACGKDSYDGRIVVRLGAASGERSDQGHGRLMAAIAVPQFDRGIGEQRLDLVGRMSLASFGFPLGGQQTFDCSAVARIVDNLAHKTTIGLAGCPRYRLFDLLDMRSCILRSGDGPTSAEYCSWILDNCAFRVAEDFWQRKTAVKFDYRINIDTSCSRC